MYRHTLVNSFASSASSGDSSTMLLVSRPKSFAARSIPRGDLAETICGSSNSSVIALPSAIRSGQNATSIATPRPTIIFSTSAVTPGNTVDRRISSWPSRRYAEQPPRAFGIAVWSGFRCSSTGVPMTTTTCSAEPTIDGSAEARRRPSATTRSSTSAAPGSSNGSWPAFTVATAAWLTS